MVQSLRWNVYNPTETVYGSAEWENPCPDSRKSIIFGSFCIIFFTKYH